MSDVLRLLPSEPTHWGLYGEFEQRCGAFLPAYGITGDAEMFRQELRQRWVNTPWLSGYFVVVEQGRIVTHCCAWHVISYGEPLIHIAQAEVNEIGDLPKAIESFAELMLQWATELTAMYAKGGQPQIKIQAAEFITRHDPVGWRALFRKKFPCTRVRSVMRIELGDNDG